MRTYGKYRTKIVLGKESSDRLSLLTQKGFLDDTGVIIVMD
ncbi:hypothetical protein GMMP15_80034 [Candidatus Magnetomoraceae bacterium gMMP-15]